MKRNQLFFICLLAITAIFLNTGCGPPQLTEPPQPPQVTQKATPPPPPPPIVYYCSHEVGSIVREGESIRLTYRSASVYADITLTLQQGGFTLESNSNLGYSTSTTANGVTHCWGENNCFIATKNRDESWTIKSLPFQ